MIIIIGIYKIENLTNHKVYIGQSIKIIHRWNQHLNSETDSLIHKAIVKYGYQNFSFTILKLCKKNELNKYEIEYIMEYDSITPRGYNIEPGGSNISVAVGENNPTAKLSEQDVYNIRESYKELKTRAETYFKYSDKVTISGFSDVWNGRSWKHIHMDVYTEETREAQKNNWDRISNHPHVIPEQTVLDIRTKKMSGKYTLKQLSHEYSDISYNTFQDIWYNNTFKHLIPDCENNYKKGSRKIDQYGVNNPQAKYKKEEIIDIKKRRDNGELPKDVYKNYSKNSTYGCFLNIWKNKTYKDIN